MMTRRLFYTLLLSIWCASASSQGLRLFSPELKAGAPKPQAVVMDFMERYFGSLNTVKHTTMQTKMADDKVYFRKGVLADLYHVVDSMPFSMNLVDRHYEVEWQKDSLPFVTVVFPAQYDLLLGMGQEEAQLRFKELLLEGSDKIKDERSTDSCLTAVQDSVPPTFVAGIDTTNLSLTTDSVWRCQTETFELESMTDAVYFNRSNSIPVFDAAHPDYSAANLFHGIIADTSYLIHVEQSVYGLTTVSYTLPFSQWLNYCAEWGLKVFFAIEEQREDGLLALVIAQSRELGFNHMLSVVIPDRFTADKDVVLKARLTPYIPTHNVKTLFQKESANHKKILWQ